MSENVTTALALSGIAKNYEGRTVVKDISLRCQVGSLTLLTGRNGSGKTTLLRIMSGLIKPDVGTVSFPAFDINNGPRIAMVAHSTFLYPQLTALENLSFWNRCLGLGLCEEELLDQLDWAGLIPFADIPARSFSRGMCQKLNLARALMQRPDILLLDEPATGLDTPSQLSLRQKLTQLKKQSMCIVLISHDETSDRALADQVLSLNGKEKPLAEERCCE